MSILRKPYEISIWMDVYNSTTNVMDEVKVAIIGSNEMTTQNRALEPKLKRNVNGTNELSFKMHRWYKDNVTGEDIENIFINEIVNETKLKLNYDGKWYDLIVKNVAEDSNNYVYTYSATDLHINELSKNGYDLVLSTDLMNNSGTVTELAASILKGSDWDVDSDNSDTLIQYIEEPLIKLDYGINGIYYGFYSCCKNKTDKFQYLSQSTIDNKEFLGEDSVYRNPNDVGQGNEANEAIIYGYGYDELTHLYYPIWTSGAAAPIVTYTELRGERMVFTHQTIFNKILGKVVYKYTKDGQQYEGFTTTEYPDPYVVQNLITNSDFASTTGWRPGVVYKGTGKPDFYDAQEHRPTLNADSYRVDDGYTDGYSTLYEDFISGAYDGKHDYLPRLTAVYKNNADYQSVVINSGIYNNRKAIKNFRPEQEFVLLWEPMYIQGGVADKFTDQVKCYISEVNYDASTDTYQDPSNNPIISFEPTSANVSIPNNLVSYRCVTGKVSENYTKTEKEFQDSNIQLFIMAPGSNAHWEVKNIQLFPLYRDANNKIILPAEISGSGATQNTTISTTYHYYNASGRVSDSNPNGWETEDEYVLESLPYDSPDYDKTVTNKKYRSIEVKQSNYFNAIQTLCETFECWADFVIEHNADGSIKKNGKKIIIREHVGQDNNVGFRSGINLQNTKRTIDSKQIVTKLIVPDNVNEFAKNGFCSIGRAVNNPSGENYIYNFLYYMNKGLLPRDEFIPKLNEHNQTLRTINDEIEELTTSLTNTLAPMNKALAQKTTSEAAISAAQESLEEAKADFAAIAKFPLGEPGREEDYKNDKLKSLVEQVAEYTDILRKQQTIFNRATNDYDKLKTRYDSCVAQINSKADDKELEIQNFYDVFYRFIQEGTWNNNECIDDEKYYMDAFSVGKESAMPKVSYSFQVLELSQLPEFQDFTFQLADKTWVEDPKFFGYNKDGTPYHEEVVLTEITYSLDEPDKNSITVQNYKNQFEDLFQKITATTQSVQYAAGAWDKAAGLVTGNRENQSQFVQDALNSDAGLELSSAKEQSVVWDNTGITVTDILVPDKVLRVVAGAILFSKDGGLTWKTGITANGISANLITAGQLDTGLIRIMNGRDVLFQWDEDGIVAYKETPDSNTIAYDDSSYVRFSKNGILGKLLNKDVFSLSWDGLYLNLGNGIYYTDGQKPTTNIETPTARQHSSYAIVGRVNDYIYNDWDENGMPCWNPNSEASAFVAVMSVGTTEGGGTNGAFTLYDNGVLTVNDIKITGSISYTSAAAPNFAVYAKTLDADWPGEGNRGDPASKDQFAITDEVGVNTWHTKYDNTQDRYRYQTYDGGKTWDGPFDMSGDKITEGYTEYNISQSADMPEDGDDKWNRNNYTQYPRDIDKFLHTREVLIYGSDGANAKIFTNKTTTQITNPVSLGLDTTSTTIGISSQGIPIGLPQYAAVIKYSLIKNIDVDGELVLFSPDEGIGEHYEWKTEDKEIRIKVDKIDELFPGREYSLVLKYKTQYEDQEYVYASQTFKFKTLVANSDYDLEFYSNSACTTISPVTINALGTGHIYPKLIKATKSTSEAKIQYAESMAANAVWTDYTSGGVGYSAGRTKPFYFRVQEGDTTWVQKVINFVNDGAKGKDGSSSTPVTVYCYWDPFSNSSDGNPTYPSKPAANYTPTSGTPTTRQPWTTDDLFATEANKYVFVCRGNRSDYTISGIEMFSYYWGEVELYDAYSEFKSVGYKKFLELTNFGENQGLYYAKDPEDDNKEKLFINAEFIQSGTLLVGDGTTPIFYASIDNTEVILATDIHITPGSLSILANEKISTNNYISYDEFGFVTRNFDKEGCSSSEFSKLPAEERVQFRQFPPRNGYYKPIFYLGRYSINGYEEGTVVPVPGEDFHDAHLALFALSANGDIVCETLYVKQTLMSPNANYDTSSSTNSDRKVKTDIESFDDRYDSLFDNLMTRRYKYTYGTSDRYHTGFIVDEVQHALSIADITEKEFAAVVTRNFGTENEMSGLRYEEFISLNTWQIQKLKPRMLTAELEITQLKSEIQELRTEIENLKNSQNSAIINTENKTISPEEIQ